MVVAPGSPLVLEEEPQFGRVAHVEVSRLGHSWRVDESDTEMCCQYVGGQMVRVLSRQFGPSESDGEIVLVDARTADVVGVHDLQRVGVGVVGVVLLAFHEDVLD